MNQKVNWENVYITAVTAFTTNQIITAAFLYL